MRLRYKISLLCLHQYLFDTPLAIFFLSEFVSVFYPHLLDLFRNAHKISNLPLIYFTPLNLVVILPTTLSNISLNTMQRIISSGSIFYKASFLLDLLRKRFIFLRLFTVPDANSGIIWYFVAINLHSGIIESHENRIFCKEIINY